MAVFALVSLLATLAFLYFLLAIAYPQLPLAGTRKRAAAFTALALAVSMAATAAHLPATNPADAKVRAALQLAGQQQRERVEADRLKREADARDPVKQAAERKRLADAAAATRAAELKKAETCRQDLGCWANKQTATVISQCREPVEQLAQYDFKWTDGILEPKFTHYRWKNKKAGEVTHLGDSIQYQNGFGAWIRHTYECDIDPSGQFATAVRARPGRLQ